MKQTLKNEIYEKNLILLQKGKIEDPKEGGSLPLLFTRIAFSENLTELFIKPDK